MGDLALAKALQSQAIQVIGERQVTRAFAKWFTLSAVAKTPRPTKSKRLTESPRQKSQRAKQMI